MPISIGWKKPARRSANYSNCSLGLRSPGSRRRQRVIRRNFGHGTSLVCAKPGCRRSEQGPLLSATFAAHCYCLLTGDVPPAMRSEYRPYPAAFFHPRMEISTGLTLVVPRGGGSGVNLGLGASARSRSRRNSFLRVRIVAKSSAVRGRFTSLSSHLRLWLETG